MLQMESYYSVDHDDSGTSLFGTEEEFSPFDGGRFLLSANMERGCKPILTVRLMPGSNHPEMVWTRSEEPEAKFQRSTNETTGESYRMLHRVYNCGT